MASLTHYVWVVVQHTLTTQLQRSTELKMSHWFYWSVSLAHQDFIFCQKASWARGLFYSFTQSHVAENSFTLTTYVSPFKANMSANWNAVSRQIWRGCHTSVDSGDLSQVPPKLSAACSTCIIPAPLVNCQFICMASAFGMSATQPILGWL